jgi:hypothetical protein
MDLTNTLILSGSIFVDPPRDTVEKFSPDQPRDEHGRFSFSENESIVGDSHLPSEHAQSVIWNKAQSMTHINQAQDPEAFASAIKQAVSKDILTEMQNNGITFEDLYKSTLNQENDGSMSAYDKELQQALQFMTSGEKLPESGIGSDYQIIIASPDAGISLIGCSRFGIDDNQPITKEEFLQKVEETPYFRNRLDSWAILDSDKAKDVAYQDKVSSFMRSWANSANDDNLTSLAMQEVAIKAFDLKDTASWTSSSSYTTNSKIGDEVTNNGKVYEAFLSAQYGATQQFFKDNNISSLEIYRGVVGNDIPIGSDVEVSTRPLSSWSTDRNTANWFASPENVPASEADKYVAGAIFHAIVPASQVLSLPITGVGCYGENEVVLLGGTFTSDSEEWITN